MPSTELLPADGAPIGTSGRPQSIERMERELPALIAAGDGDTIKRWRDEGKAASLAAGRMGLAAEAQQLGRAAIRCSAALGVIAGRTLGRGGLSRGRFEGLPLHIIRPLGAALERGRLEQALDAAGDTLSEPRVCRSVNALGLTGVSRARVASLLKQRAAERGIRLGEVLGGREATLRPSHSPRMEWWTAYRLAVDVGVDLERVRKLPPVRPSKRARRTRFRSKWLTHRFRPGDGRWDEVGVRMIAMRDELTRADADWPNKPLLYEAMKTISDIVQREIRAAEGVKS